VGTPAADVPRAVYNDRPGSYGDDFGSLSITVDRTKS
jgi:hypothetical protein